MIDIVLDLLFPKRCVNCRKLGTYLCSDCFSTVSFADNPAFTSKNQILGVNYSRVVRRLLNRFREEPYMRSLRPIISRIFIESLYSNQIFMTTLPQQPIVTFMPLSSVKLRKQGYNPTELLARDISNEFKIEILDIFKFTKSFENSFEIPKSIDKIIKNKTVIFVDDLFEDPSKYQIFEKALKLSGVNKTLIVAFSAKVKKV